MGRGWVTAWVGAAAAMTVAVLACRQLVGIGDSPPQGSPVTPTDAGAEGGFTYGQGACAACVTTSCATQAMACAGTPSCAALEGCMSGCGTDPTCRAQCGVDHGLGNDVATPAFEACLASSCSTECGLTCGGLAAVFPPATATACEACIEKGSGCALVNECAVDVGCQTGLRCQFSSDTPDLQQACPLLWPDAGIPLLTAAKNPPIASSCSMECSWGADWSCLGRVDWPLATRGPVTLTIDVDDIQSGLPVAGATVKVCGVEDSPCSMPIAHPQITGDSGTVVMSNTGLPMQEAFFVDVSSPTITPLILSDVAWESQSRFRFPATTLPATMLSEVAAAAQVTLGANLGVVVVAMHDCRLAPAPGVTFTISPQGPALVYNSMNLPDPMATATDSQGVGVFYNVDVAPAFYTVTIFPPAPGHAPSTAYVFTRAGTEAILYAVPTQ